MSEINDALKRARQISSPTPNLTNGIKAASLPPRPPRPEKPSQIFGWLIPVFIVVLVAAAIFFIGWATLHRPGQKVVSAANPVIAKPLVAEVPAVPQPHLTPSTLAAAPAPKIAPAPPQLPKLQGIFYSSTAPSAILDGKTISVGDQFGDYRVQQISSDAVILLTASGREIKIKMGH